MLHKNAKSLDNSDFPGFLFLLCDPYGTELKPLLYGFAAVT
jgi:hypothetical protein